MSLLRRGAAHPGDLPGLGLVATRPLSVAVTSTWLDLTPGDRPLVGIGDEVVVGTPVAERLHERWTEEIRSRGETVARLRPGRWWAAAAAVGSGEPRGRARPGEVLFSVRGRWRIATGDRHETLESPVAGVVEDVQPGAGVRIRFDGLAIPGVELIGAPVRGRLEVLAPAAGEMRAGSVDVALAGRIVVAGARIDAEALSRARATGVAGIVVASLGSRERRDVAASERRQRAALRPPPPFGILVLEGASRRSIPGPVFAALQGLVGRTLALVGSPPALIIETEPFARTDADDGGPTTSRRDPSLHHGVIAPPRPGHVRVRSGGLAGREGIWGGLAGPRVFDGGIVAEGAFVRFGSDAPVAVPLGSLERFV